jgi:chaperonin GroEL
VLFEALSAPARAIARNAGFPNMAIGYDYKGGRGFDSRSKTFVNMFEAGITDPASITLNAVRNAISVAATILTAPTIITIPRESEPERPQPPVIL